VDEEGFPIYDEAAREAIRLTWAKKDVSVIQLIRIRRSAGISLVSEAKPHSMVQQENWIDIFGLLACI
jgi:hypothetical protein